MANGRAAVGLKRLINGEAQSDNNKEEGEDSRERKRRRKASSRASKTPGLREQAIVNASGQLTELKEILLLRTGTILSRAMERANQELGHNRVAKREMWDIFSESQQKAEMFIVMDRDDIKYYVERWTGRKIIWGPKDDIRLGEEAGDKFKEGEDRGNSNSNSREVGDE